VYDGGPYEVLVEHQGGELLVRGPVVELGLLAVRERLAPQVVRHAVSVDLCGQ
jgi:hypothetical protein